MNPVAQPSEVGTASTLANPSLSKEIPLLGAKWVLLLLAGLDADSKTKLYRRRTRAQELMKCVLWLIKKKSFLEMIQRSKGRLSKYRASVWIPRTHLKTRLIRQRQKSLGPT